MARFISSMMVFSLLTDPGSSLKLWAL